MKISESVFKVVPFNFRMQLSLYWRKLSFKKLNILFSQLFPWVGKSIFPQMRHEMKKLKLPLKGLGSFLRIWSLKSREIYTSLLPPSLTWEQGVTSVQSIIWVYMIHFLKGCSLIIEMLTPHYSLHSLDFS